MVCFGFNPMTAMVLSLNSSGITNWLFSISNVFNIGKTSSPLSFVTTARKRRRQIPPLSFMAMRMQHRLNLDCFNEMLCLSSALETNKILSAGVESNFVRPFSSLNSPLFK